jgi:hypothetical protein
MYSPGLSASGNRVASTKYGVRGTSWERNNENSYSISFLLLYCIQWPDVVLLYL